MPGKRRSLLCPTRFGAFCALLAAILAPSVARSQILELSIPADFEQHPALLVGASQMIFHHPQVLVDIAEAMQGSAQVMGLVNDSEQAERMRSLLREHGLPSSAVVPVIAPNESMWIRDFGPVFIRDSAGNVGLIDARYGGTRDNPSDERVPRALGQLWNAPVIDAPIWLEGGQILSNGRGLLLISTVFFTKNALQDGIGGQEITARLQSSLPFDRAEVIQPLHGESTGHLDIFMSFLDVDLLLVSRLDPHLDSTNAGRLDEYASRLEGLPTEEGPLRVVRVDAPPAVDGIWRTYTNTSMAGNVVLVPSYSDVDPVYDEQALALYREHFPRRTVTAIDASSLVARNGALHCVSIPLPVLPHAFARHRPEPSHGFSAPTSPTEESGEDTQH